MLVKKELLSVPIGDCPRCKSGTDFAVTAQVANLPRSGEVLVADFFEKKQIHARFFYDRKNYTVFFAASQCWSRAYPIGGTYYYRPSTASTEETDRIVDAFIPETKTTYRNHASDIILSYIGEQNADKRFQAWTSLHTLMKKHIAMFPDYPANLREYSRENIFPHDYIFLAKKAKRNQRRGRCSHCGVEFDVENGAVSGNKTICPVCGTNAVYRGAWMKGDVSDIADICIADKVDNQLILRWVTVSRCFEWPELKEKIRFDDFAYSLYLVVNGTPKIYTYKWFKAPYAYDAEWHRLPIDSTCDSRAFIYTDNLDKVFGTNYYNVDLKAGLQGKHIKFSFSKLLDELRNTPKAEYLFKLGLPMLATSASCIRDYPNGQGVFQKQVGITKQYLPMCRDMSVDFREYLILKNSPQWITPEILQQYRDFKAGNSPAFDDLFSLFGITKVLSYIEKQRRIHPKEKVSHLAICHRDYLNMSNDLHVDMSHKSVLFPSDIVDAHKTMTARYNAAKNEIKLEKAARLNATFHDCAVRNYEARGITAFSQGEYQIVLPMQRTDLIVEGQSLNHCVGGDSYAKKHMEGNLMIFFVRKQSEPEKPFFTMELDLNFGRIIQLYGFGDCSAPSEVRKFAEAFAQYTQRKKARKTA